MVKLQVEQARDMCEGSANKDQKCGRDMKKTIKHRTGSASYGIHSASPLIRHPQRVHRL